MMRKPSRPQMSPIMVAIVIALTVFLYLLFVPRQSSTLTSHASTTDEHNNHKHLSQHDRVAIGAQHHDDDYEFLYHNNMLEGMIATRIDGKEIDLMKYSDKLVLVVNVASQCGFTELNYRELADMHNTYRHFLDILAFPCNQFGSQEPGTATEIRKFAGTKGAKFDLFQKTNVNGPKTHPFYQRLKHAMNVTTVEWNFGKFLLAKGGRPLRYYDHRFPFEVLKRHIAALSNMKLGKEHHESHHEEKK